MGQAQWARPTDGPGPIGPGPVARPIGPDPQGSAIGHGPGPGPMCPDWKQRHHYFGSLRQNTIVYLKICCETLK